jgi:hypothetical protein
MPLTERRLAVLAAVLVSLARSPVLSAADPPGPTSSPRAWGLNDQVLNVGAAAFHTEHWAYQYFQSQSDGYLYLAPAGEGAAFTAPLTLPPGALITSMCLYGVDTSGGSVTVRLESVRLVPGGQPSDVRVVESFSTDFDIGYGVTCADLDSPYTVRDLLDVDGDGTPDEDVVHRLRVALTNRPGDVALGGVRIFWRQQVSPPPAAATFNDVPTSDPAFQFVEALAASGITAGCGNGIFCPDAPLTRRQMAVFLAKALGLDWPN